MSAAPVTRLAAVEQALELLGRDVNAERELVGDSVEDLEARMFTLMRAHGASQEQLDEAAKRWNSDPEGALRSLFGEDPARAGRSRVTPNVTRTG